MKLRAVIFFESAPAAHRPKFEGKFIEVDHEQFDKWVWTIHYFPWPNPKISHQRLNENTKLYALIEGDIPVCLGWVTRSSTFPLGELEGKCDFDPPTDMIWDCVTLANERRKGHFTRFLTGLQARFPQTTFSIFCLPDNHASAGSIRKAGFRPWSFVRVSRFGTKVKMFSASGGRISFHF